MKQIPHYIDSLKEIHPNFWNLPSSYHIIAAREEIFKLREYIKELEDFREQVTELPVAFQVHMKGYKPFVLQSLIAAQAIQDSEPDTEVFPLYSYKGLVEEYPKEDVVTNCICGSWPGGKCLKCERVVL